MPVAAAYDPLLNESYNPDEIPIETYLTMRRRDPIIKMAKGFVERSVRRRIGDYKHEDPRVEEWVKARIMPALKRDMRFLQSAMYYGVAMAQPIWGVVDGDLTLQALLPVSARRFWHGWIERDPETGIPRSVQIDNQDVPFFDPVTNQRQLVLYSSDDDWGRPWGNPAARQMYTAWFIKNRLLAFEAMALEAHGTPLGTIAVQDDALQTDGVSKKAAYAAAWSQLGARSSFVHDAADEVTVHPPAWTGASPFDAAIRRCDAYIFNSLYMPYLITSESQFGTRAQAGTALESYLMVETDIVEEQADEVCRDQIIAVGIWRKFGPNAGPGELSVRDPSPPDRLAWSQILTALYNVEAWRPEVAEQLEWAGEIFEVPVEELGKLLAAGGPLQTATPAGLQPGPGALV